MLLKKFMGLPKIVRIILLFVPFVNWVCEMIIRWTLFAEKKDLGSLIMAIVVTVFFGNIVGIVDAIFTIISDKLVLTDLKVSL